MILVRIKLKIFGEKAQGIIVAHSDYSSSARGFTSYPYRVNYVYEDELYYAKSLDSATGTKFHILRKNYHKEVMFILI